MIDCFTLGNGLRVTGERLPHLRSVSIGVWVKAGSILETAEDNGLSHFLEHMAFKGTRRRSARQIAEEMDAIGGMLNAATSKTCTCYYAKVIDEDLPVAADILADIVRNAVYDEEELKKERGVIVEEIGMVEDTPEDVVYDLLAEAVFAGQPLGKTILGPREKIESYTREDLLAFRARHYGPQNAVVSVAGNYDPDALRALMEEYFGDWQGAGNQPYPAETAVRTVRALARDKDTEQVQLCLGYPGKPLGSPDVYAVAVFNNILGGGMSSRLFQRIREDLGMAYSIYSSPAAYPGCGEMILYAGTSPKHVQTVIEQIDILTQKLLEEGVSDKEFTQARAQLKGSFILGQESAYSRMSGLGHNLLLLGRTIPAEETIAGIERVSMDDVMRVAGEILRAPRCAAVVGKTAEQYLRFFA